MRRTEKAALQEQVSGGRIMGQVLRDVASGNAAAFYGGGGAGLAAVGEPSLGGKFDADGNFVAYWRAGMAVGSAPVKKS